MAKVVGIYISPDQGALMQSVQSVQAIAGVGLEGDRYAMQRGSWMRKDATRHSSYRQVTFIAIEGIADANGELSKENRFTPAQTRRNIIIEGFHPEQMLRTAEVKEVFQVGEALVRFVKDAEPCDRPDKLSHKTGFEKAFQRRGGINAEIIQSGKISVGDSITLLPSLA